MNFWLWALYLASALLALRSLVSLMEYHRLYYRNERLRQRHEHEIQDLQAAASEAKRARQDRSKSSAA